MKMEESEDCILCKIVNGEIKSWTVYEDDFSVGILDVNPCVKGHCLVIPKKHVERFYDMDEEDLGRLFSTVKIVANKIKKAINPDFVCIFIRGGRVSHLHVAVFPSMKNDSLSGFPQSSFEKITVNLDEVAERIRNA
ncbi:MAG: HIT domain-containing protein [Candidatus Altiarchaeota archaeon]|nr:HIT domain-containing protein [Candidatus Altiarchaeota archaeon]